jgi:hypothetical protein
MGGKMNWDRVRKENQIGRSGSTWIGSDALSQTPSREVKSSRKRKSTKKRQPSGWAKIPGCTCGKALGFQGSHKKKCPFGGADAQRGSSSYNNPFAECVKKAGSGLPQRQFLLSLQTEVRLAPGISVSDRAAAQKLIQALLESSSARPDRNQQRNKANGLSDWHPLKELIERRLDVYLRAPTNAALAAVDSVASELSLQSYRFQCSTSTSDWELWGHIDKGGSYHPHAFFQGVYERWSFLHRAVRKIS